MQAATARHLIRSSGARSSLSLRGCSGFCVRPNAATFGCRPRRARPSTRWSAHLPPREHHLAAAGWRFRRPSRQHRPDRDRRNRRRRGESWQFRRSVASTIARNAGRPENDSRGCRHFAERVSGIASRRPTSRRRRANRGPLLPPDRRSQPPGHSIGNRPSHVAAGGICDRDNEFDHERMVVTCRNAASAGQRLRTASR